VSVQGHASGLTAEVLALLRSGIDVPLPGGGDTARRFAELRSQSGNNPSVGRLFEAHVDALAILHEAGVSAPPQAAMAVWAAGGRQPLRLQHASNGKVRLAGRKSFCGGASLVDLALVTATSVEGEQLVLVDLHADQLHIDETTWKSDAFRDSGTCTVDFHDLEVPVDALIGPPGWYGSRAGFWHGAAGVAAVWAGIADAVIARMIPWLRHSDQVAEVAIGRSRAATWAIDAALTSAAAHIDAHPTENALTVALACRHTVGVHIDAILRSFDQEVGPAATAFDADLARLRCELGMALAQGHGDRDLAELARAPA
jgi:alkylation response protein AidB-like acyl-CoA dehydrogenase